MVSDLEESQGNASWEDDRRGQVARITQANFGRYDGMFGLHIRLVFATNHSNDFVLSTMEEIRVFMDALGAKTLPELINRLLRMQRLPLPLAGYEPVLDERRNRGTDAIGD